MPFTIKCPTCHKDAAWEYNPHRPFCSDRCRLIDLGAWTAERCRIPGGDIDTNVGDNQEDNQEKAN